MSPTSIPATNASKIWCLPAYTTILCQTFSPNNDYLAVGSDRGRIAIFRVSDLVSAGRENTGSDSSKMSCLLYLDVNESNDDTPFTSSDSVNTLSTTKTFLIAGISASKTNSAKILAWAWKDILKEKVVQGSELKLAASWSIESNLAGVGGHPLLPTDINALVVDENCDGAAAGRIFVAGGTCGLSNSLDHSIRVIDLETRSETSSPLKGHEGYLHDVSYCEQTKTLASASEDGTVKLWDLRVSKKEAQEIRPSKWTNLARPQLGRWVGAVSLSGELLCCGGGPKAALYHLRTLSPIDPDGLQLPTSTENSGALHVIEIFSEENRILLGGEMQGKLYQTNLSGELIAEIDTSSSCLYSVVYMCSESLKLMSCAGSSSKIDLCTANFSYRDRTVTFPTHL